MTRPEISKIRMDKLIVVLWIIASALVFYYNEAFAAKGGHNLRFL
jgi:hypothetical protein